MAEKKLLYEVSIIRPLIIFLLVVLHSFTMYGGGWSLPEGIDEVGAYYWLCKLISGFRVETIALIAGYVFAYQSVVLGRKYEFKSFAVKKIKRLLFPMLFFGLIYYFCFKFDAQTFSWTEFLMSIFSGVGHLWFLPMLFWCFLSIWTIDRFKLSSIWLFCILAVISLIPIPISLPFGFQRLTYFLFYCYAGYYLYLNKAKVLARLSNVPSITILWVLYFVLLLVNYLVITPAGWESGVVGYERYARILVSAFLKLLYSCFGILAIYLIVTKFTENESYQPKKWIIESSSLCYGVYVYHQFLLVFIYYYTSLPSLVGTYWLPFVGFTIAIFVSVFLAKVTLKTKFGRMLIG